MKVELIFLTSRWIHGYSSSRWISTFMQALVLNTKYFYYIYSLILHTYVCMCVCTHIHAHTPIPWYECMGPEDNIQVVRLTGSFSSRWAILQAQFQIFLNLIMFQKKMVRGLYLLSKHVHFNRVISLYNKHFQLWSCLKPITVVELEWPQANYINSLLPMKWPFENKNISSRKNVMQ